VRAAIAIVLSAGIASAQELRVQFFDVGQGDAALVTSPAGRTVLIDGGPPEGTARLLERLRGRGAIDLVILSHRHLDHLGGLARVIEEVGARAYMDAEFPHPSPEYVRLLRALAANRVAVREARAGRTVDLGGGATLTLLAPPSPPLQHTRSDVNANSLVLRVDFGEVRVLFTGDAEAETERWLLANPAALRARVVKVAHHGSRHSSGARFVAAVGAELAVMSAGAGNEYGHPTPEAVGRWEAAGARVLRTDLDGEIEVTSDGRAIVVRTERRVAWWLGRRRAAAPACDYRRRLGLAARRAAAGEWWP
jgi:competence protein ComEC